MDPENAFLYRLGGTDTVSDKETATVDLPSARKAANVRRNRRQSVRNTHDDRAETVHNRAETVYNLAETVYNRQGDRS